MVCIYIYMYVVWYIYIYMYISYDIYIYTHTNIVSWYICLVYTCMDDHKHGFWKWSVSRYLQQQREHHPDPVHIRPMSIPEILLAARHVLNYMPDFFKQKITHADACESRPPLRVQRSKVRVFMFFAHENTKIHDFARWVWWAKPLWIQVCFIHAISLVVFFFFSAQWLHHGSWLDSRKVPKWAPPWNEHTKNSIHLNAWHINQIWNPHMTIHLKTPNTKYWIILNPYNTPTSLKHLYKVYEYNYPLVI